MPLIMMVVVTSMERLIYGDDVADGEDDDDVDDVHHGHGSDYDDDDGDADDARKQKPVPQNSQP